MGLLGKVIGTAACIVGAGAQAIGKGIENAFLKQEQKNLEYLLKYPYNHKYIVREVKRKMDDMEFAQTMGLKTNFFAVYNTENKPIIVAKQSSASEKNKFIITDLDSNELARIEVKRSIFSSSKQSCIISTQSEKYEIGTNVSFEKRKFSLNDGSFQIVCNDSGKELKISKQRKTIMQINKINSDLGVKWGEYIIGCNEQEYTLMLILLSLSIAIMLVESDNILD